MNAERHINLAAYMRHQLDLCPVLEGNVGRLPLGDHEEPPGGNLSPVLRVRLQPAHGGPGAAVFRITAYGDIAGIGCEYAGDYYDLPGFAHWIEATSCQLEAWAADALALDDQALSDACAALREAVTAAEHNAQAQERAASMAGLDEAPVAPV